ncbi:DNA repair protein rhp54 [Hordeum vulgare]|nr:DNA repair protein rhp54 [Hordeum vulgare]
MVLLESSRASTTHPIPGFHVYPQASRLPGECSPEVSMVAPSTPAPTAIDLKAIRVAGGSSSGGSRTRAREMSVDMLSGTRNLFDGMPATVDDERANHFMQSIIFEEIQRRRLEMKAEKQARMIEMRRRRKPRC